MAFKMQVIFKVKYKNKSEYVQIYDLSNLCFINTIVTIVTMWLKCFLKVHTDMILFVIIKLFIYSFLRVLSYMLCQE